MKPTCRECAKGVADRCDNVDGRPLRLCFKPTEAALDAEARAADLAVDERRDRRFLDVPERM